MKGILLIDKPQDWTSHDVVAKLRGILGERRIGHSGTLDPIATGLLCMFIGRATRAVEFAESHDKEYTAGLRLGFTSDTFDITGTVSRTGMQIPGKRALEAVLTSFRGDIVQLPPMYSAVKQNGKRLYQYARTGVEVERKPRAVRISALDIAGETGGDYLLSIHCSKGTYIRSLCHDIGQALGCGGVMSSLRRTKSGQFSIDGAYSLDEVQAAEHGEAEKLLLPVDCLFSGYPEILAEPEQENRLRNGTAVSAQVPDGTYRVYGSGGFFLLGKAVDGKLSVLKNF